MVMMMMMMMIYCVGCSAANNALHNSDNVHNCRSNAHHQRLSRSHNRRRRHLRGRNHIRSRRSITIIPPPRLLPPPSTPMHINRAMQRPPLHRLRVCVCRRLGGFSMQSQYIRRRRVFPARFAPAFPQFLPPSAAQLRRRYAAGRGAAGHTVAVCGELQGEISTFWREIPRFGSTSAFSVGSVGVVAAEQACDGLGGQFHVGDGVMCVCVCV